MKIEINKLKKTYDREVLRDITVSDYANTLAIIGKSGCGKSTLLRILGGLEHKTSGVASLKGLEVHDSAEYRRKVGFVFQHSGLFSHLNAVQNISLPLEKVHNLTQDDAKKCAYDLLERFGLENEAEKKPAQLSGGQKQRIAIARAVAPKPKVLLLDEPTSALDPEYTSEVLNVINELKKEDLSFIIATHEMGFALNSCEKVMFMDEGIITEYGESEKLFKTPQTEKLQSFLSNILKWKM